MASIASYSSVGFVEEGLILEQHEEEVRRGVSFANAVPLKSALSHTSHYYHPHTGGSEEEEESSAGSRHVRFHESDVIYSEARERSRFGMRRRGRTKTKQLLPIVVYTEHEGKDIEKANLNHSMVQKLMKLKRTNSKEINSPRLEDDNEDVDLENIDTEKYHALLQKQKISNKKPSPRMRSFEEDLKRLEELRDSARVSRVPTPASLRGSTSTTPTSSAKNSPSKPLVAKDDAIAALYENVVEHKEDDSTSNRNSGGVATPHQQHLLDLGEEIQLLHDEYDDDEDDDEDDEGIIYVGGSSNKYVRHDSVMLRKEDNSNKVYYDDYDDYDAEDIVSYDEIEDKESSESRITTTNTKVNSAPSYAPTTSSAGKASSQFAIPLLALNSFSGNATNSMSKDASPYTSPRLSLEGFNADGSSSVPAVKYKPHRLSGSQNDLNVGIAEHQTAIQSSSSIISETIRLQGEAMNRLSIGSSNSKMSSEEGSKSSSTSSSSRNSTPSHSRSGSGSFPPLPPQQTSSSEVNALQKYVPYELSEEDSLRLMLLLSHQENVYGIHMFDALNLTDPFSDDNDDVRQVQREKRLDTPHQYEEAVKIVFERKFGKPITPIKKVSTTTTISSSTSLGNLEKLDNTSKSANGSDNLNHISGSRSSVGSSSTTSVSYPQQQGAVVVEDYNTRPLSSSINSNVVGDNNGVTGGLAAANAINDGSGLFRMRNNFQIPPIYIPPASTSFGSGNVSSANTPSYGNTPHAIAGNPYAGNTPHANSYAQTQSNMSNAAQHASSGKRTPSLYNSNMPPSIPSSSGHGNGKFPLATDGQQHQSGVRRSQIPLPPATSTPTAGSTNGVKYYNGTNSTTSSIYGNTPQYGATGPTDASGNFIRPQQSSLYTSQGYSSNGDLQSSIMEYEQHNMKWQQQQSTSTPSIYSNLHPSYNISSNGNSKPASPKNSMIEQQTQSGGRYTSIYSSAESSQQVAQSPHYSYNQHQPQQWSATTSNGMHYYPPQQVVGYPPSLSIQPTAAAANITPTMYYVHQQQAQQPAVLPTTNIILATSSQQSQQHVHYNHHQQQPNKLSSSSSVHHKTSKVASSSSSSASRSSSSQQHQYHHH